MAGDPIVLGVFASGRHSISKYPQDGITLLAGLGVAGDAHCGVTVQHRWDARRNPQKPNLRQVHLIQAELLDELAAKGFAVTSGDMGENIATRGLDLLALPTAALLHLGDAAIVELTGLRHPCLYLDRLRQGLKAAVSEISPDGKLVRKAGVMGIVRQGGRVQAGDRIAVTLPDGPPAPLKPV